MKTIYLIITFSVIAFTFIGCIKNDSIHPHNTMGSITFNNGMGDSTTYTITTGELNVNGNGVYATTAESGNTALNIAITGQLVNGPNLLNNGGNSLLVVITSITGGTVNDYSNVYGGFILNGTTLTFELTVSTVIDPNNRYLVTGSVKY